MINVIRVCWVKEAFLWDVENSLRLSIISWILFSTPSKPFWSSNLTASFCIWFSISYSFPIALFSFGICLSCLWCRANGRKFWRNIKLLCIIVDNMKLLLFTLLKLLLYTNLPVSPNLLNLLINKYYLNNALQFLLLNGLLFSI